MIYQTVLLCGEKFSQEKEILTTVKQFPQQKRNYDNSKKVITTGKRF